MLLKPQLKKEHITDICLKDINDLGVDTLILDVDNTLSLHHSMEAAKGVIEWIETMKSQNINLIILSNARRARVEPFAKMLGLEFISLAKKPLVSGYRKVEKKLGTARCKIAAVGDQLFTDMLGANLAGIKSILVTPYQLEDKWNFKIRRRIERLFLNKYGY